MLRVNLFQNHKACSAELEVDLPAKSVTLSNLNPLATRKKDN